MLKGEDTFRTECVNSISEDSIVSLLNLYQPLIGGEGVLLYLTLHAEGRYVEVARPEGESDGRYTAQKGKGKMRKGE